VANEAITNFSRMPQRRVEQTLGLTYDTTLEQLKVFMEDVRALLKTDPGVDQKSIVVNFVNYGDSSLDVQVVYFTSDPDFTRHLELRERINLKIMQALVARGLSFAYPTHTLQLDGPVAKALIRGAGEGLAAKA
jgi:MscS family membrane protein